MAKRPPSRTRNPFCYFVQAMVRYQDGKRSQRLKLTPQFLRELWDNQGGRCAYTNLRMILPTLPIDSSATLCFDPKKNLLFAASLDRKDSQGNYTPANVHFVCRFVNLGKSTASESQTRIFVRALRRRPK